MSYVALYRRYRPERFGDVKGQEAIVQTLQNQLRHGRVAHAYVFTGTRGTGKTTLAKLLAKAANCRDLQDGDPCGLCASCMAIAAGASLNVIEMDAASNNGVDNIRDVVEQMAFPPVEGKYKAYIIDEAHMLSNNAWNALLKTLEEPPPYAMFILATTEVAKIPVTILSRCQRYDFRRIGRRVILERLEELAAKEGIQAQKKALEYISGVADGALRDALSLLDRCATFSGGGELRYETVLEILGASEGEAYARLLECVANQDVGGALALYGDMDARGVDTERFAADMVVYLRNLLLAQVAPQQPDLQDGSFQQGVEELAAGFRPEEIIRCIQVMSALGQSLRQTSYKKVFVELALIRLCRPQMEGGDKEVGARLAAVERQLERGLPMAPAAPSSPEALPSAAEAGGQRAILAAALPENVKKITKNWESLLRSAGQPLRTYLARAGVSLGEGGRLLLVCQEQTLYDLLDQAEQREAFQTLADDCAQGHVDWELRLAQRLEEYPDIRQLWRSAIVGMEVEMDAGGM